MMDAGGQLALTATHFIPSDPLGHSSKCLCEIRAKYRKAKMLGWSKGAKLLHSEEWYTSPRKQVIDSENVHA